ncbi:MAG: hypothetical protein ABSA57_05665 [Candidatus Acidiferrales bacterium]
MSRRPPLRAVGAGDPPFIPFRLFVGKIFPRIGRTDTTDNVRTLVRGGRSVPEVRPRII